MNILKHYFQKTCIYTNDEKPAIEKLVNQTTRTYHVNFLFNKNQSYVNINIINILEK